MERNRDIENESMKREKKSEMQQAIDRQLQSPELKDMHLESGEKINEYECNK